MQVYIDEAGRGPLAWPMFVGLVVIKEELEWSQYPLFDDSKKLTPAKRELAYTQLQSLMQSGYIWMCAAQIDAESIDAYGLTRALNIAISKGIGQLCSHILGIRAPKSFRYADILTLLQKIKKKADFAQGLELVIDGKSDFGLSDELQLPVKTVIGGDAKVKGISMASIIAKVCRDRRMEELDREYPAYGFALHKGYGTRRHYEAIERYGLSPQHRKLFLKKMIPEWEITLFDRERELP